MGLESLKQKAKNLDNKFKLRSAYEIVPDWIDNEIEVRKNPMTTGFPDFDKVLRNNLRGKLGVFAGYGGTKKSLFALNLSCHNAFMNEDQGKKGAGVYSTMEMSATNLLDRMIDFQFGRMKDGVVSSRAVDMWRYRLTEENRHQIQKELQDAMKKFYGDRLLISQKSRMTGGDYRQLLDGALEKNENIHSLISDGLAGMGGIGSETDLFSENTMALKEIANEYNIFTGVIAHLSKGADIDTRNVAQYIRGSQKILDNCDFYFMFSLIKDPMNDGEVEKDKGYIRLVDKRGSGSVVNQIYSFDEDRLLLEPSSIDPSIYGDDVQEKKTKYG